MIQKILIIAFLDFFAINGYAQDNMLCQFAYWTEDQANIIMKKWAGEWKTRADWEKRAKCYHSGNHQRDETGQNEKALKYNDLRAF